METTYLLFAELVIFLTVSASNNGFYYLYPWFRRGGEEVCKMCYGENDCLTLNQARCELYTATSDVLYWSDYEGPVDPGRPELRSQVDELVMDLVEHASASPAFNQCIPLVSQYTDCTKENICLGCMTCECDWQGSWNCSSSQRCRPEVPLEVDHRALVYAVETLRGGGVPSFRLKRYASTPTRIPHQVTYDELAQWMYDTSINTGDDAKATTEDYNTADAINGDIGYMDRKNEADYIAFDDVLQNIAVDAKNYSRRKTLSNESTNEHHYKNLVDFEVNYGDTDAFNEISQSDTTDGLTSEDNEINVTSVATTEAITTKVVIDLLESARKRIGVKLDKADTLNRTAFENFPAVNNFEEYDEFNSLIKKKRDVSNDITSIDGLISTDKEVTTQTTVIEELDDGVYQPLSRLIQDKRQELEDLVNIKEKLVQILKLNQTNEYSVILNKTETMDKSNQSHYFFYNLELVPESELAYKRSNSEDLEKYVTKLKRDIFTVMKDVAILQRLTDRHNMQPELKILIRAMKHYIHKSSKSHTKNLFRSKNISDYRRHKSGENIDNDFLKKHLIDILQAINKNMAQSNALAPLSPKAKKIIRQIIKAHKITDFSAIGLRVNDPNYNLTNDLKTIGAQWQDMAVKISGSSPWDKLHYMKLLQFILESDINKMNDALALIDFAHSRRMYSIHDDISGDEILRINDNLRSIHDKISKIITYKKNNRKKEVNKIIKWFTADNETKKETFIKHIKNLLKSSKRDIINLLHKKVPKTDIIREIAKKKLSELTKKKLLEYEYKKVMQKCQTNLDVNNRRKRSPLNFEVIQKRIKNILPKYLRGKVNHKINSTRSKNRSRNLNKTQSKRNKHTKTSKQTTHKPKNHERGQYSNDNRKK